VLEHVKNFDNLNKCVNSCNIHNILSKENTAISKMFEIVKISIKIQCKWPSLRKIIIVRL